MKNKKIYLTYFYIFLLLISLFIYTIEKSISFALFILLGFTGIIAVFNILFGDISKDLIINENNIYELVCTFFVLITSFMGALFFITISYSSNIDTSLRIIGSLTFTSIFIVLVYIIYTYFRNINFNVYGIDLLSLSFYIIMFSSLFVSSSFMIQLLLYKNIFYLVSVIPLACLLYLIYSFSK